ncbi:hypothetical protein [Gordonia sihwensis]|uniref:hypothetical protein n=1 Tax=Gordonia sihwensis TaxID=173559 RepID=UPI0005F09DBC|nr:hypothetical protein [Gordonia sihwensis]KJR10265.1 hypothetical protein UG54_01415 [Gordonia sihwensis]
MITLKQHLLAHRHSLGMGRCSCGHPDDPERKTIAGVQDDHAAHVAATWREARIVRTVEDLDMLPAMTIIRYPVDFIDHSMVYERFVDSATGETGWFLGEEVVRILPASLPALVVWTPEDVA